jgi:hypothetical protein
MEAQVRQQMDAVQGWMDNGFSALGSTQILLRFGNSPRMVNRPHISAIPRL